MGEISELEPPEPLADHHDIQDFRSGEASLDDAISEVAKKFYWALGFDASPSEPMRLMVTFSDIRAFFHIAMKRLSSACGDNRTVGYHFPRRLV